MINWLIRLLCYFRKPINGDPNVWLERKWHGEWISFICGSCHGLYRTKAGEFQILAVHNTKKNDNFDRVLDWFQKSCRRDKSNLAFLEIGNPKLLVKLERLGFVGNQSKMVKLY